MTTKAAAIITTIAINGGLNSTRSFDGGDDDEFDIIADDVSGDENDR